MGLLFGFLIVLYVLVCIALVFLVLIQSDKGGGISGAIGGGLASAGSMLGTQDTANILTRGTTIFASAFMVLCILLSVMVGSGALTGRGESLLKQRAETQESYSPSSILEGEAQEGELPVLPPAEGQQGGDGAAEGGETQVPVPPEGGQEQPQE